jgi:hypothetical protein
LSLPSQNQRYTVDRDTDSRLATSLGRIRRSWAISSLPFSGVVRFLNSRIVQPERHLSSPVTYPVFGLPPGTPKDE